MNKSIIDQISNMKKRYLLWFVLCVIVFVFSTFVHECGHGLSSALMGQPVSTGFNRVGNVYMYPKDNGFRANVNLNANSLIDFGVPATLLLAIVFTILYCKRKFKKPIVKAVVLSIALCNSIIRLVPALLTIILPIFTGKLHLEDEVQTGLELEKILHFNAAQYVPVLFSIGISVLCLLFLIKNVRKDKNQNLRIYASLFASAYFVAFIIENTLDNLIRINWIF